MAGDGGSKAVAKVTPTQVSIDRYNETREIGVQLQRIALRLAELGEAQCGADALRAAVRCSRVRPSKVP